MSPNRGRKVIEWRGLLMEVCTVYILPPPSPSPQSWGMGEMRRGEGKGSKTLTSTVYIGNDLHPQSGAFARYISVKGDIQLRIPQDTSFEAASAIGVGVISAGFALYKILRLPYPSPQSEPVDQQGRTILIYGGSTATGTLAIQFAKLSVFIYLFLSSLSLSLHMCVCVCVWKISCL